MPINDVTATQGFQKPNAANLLSEDVVRLRAALDALDTEINNLELSRATLASPTFTGTPAAPTAAVDTNTTQIATTAFVIGQSYLKTATASSTYAPLASPTFTGMPTVPSPAAGDTSTRIASTSWVIGQASNLIPNMDSGTGNQGTSIQWARGNHTHPTDTTRAPLASPTFTGTVTLPAVSYTGAASTTSTGSWAIPRGTTLQRSAPASGAGLRFNSDNNLFEGWTGTDWSALGQGATGGGSDQIFQENGQTVTTNYTIPSGRNAISAGPITVANGVTVTVSAGSTWVVV